MAKYNQFNKHRPLVRFTTKKFFKYNGVHTFDRVLGVIQQETEKAYLIYTRVKSSWGSSQSTYWFVKSKTQIEKLGMIQDINGNWKQEELVKNETKKYEDE